MAFQLFSVYDLINELFKKLSEARKIRKTFYCHLESGEAPPVKLFFCFQFLYFLHTFSPFPLKQRLFLLWSGESRLFFLPKLIQPSEISLLLGTRHCCLRCGSESAGGVCCHLIPYNKAVWIEIHSHCVNKAAVRAQEIHFLLWQRNMYTQTVEEMEWGDSIVGQSIP